MGEIQCYKDIIDLVDQCSRLEVHEELTIEMEILNEFLREDKDTDVIIEAQRLLFPFSCSIYLAQEKVKIIKLK